MTSSDVKRFAIAASMLALTASSWAGLGDGEGSITNDRMRMRAMHSVVRSQWYSVHELKVADGSRVHQFTTSSGMVFAVSWSTTYKPDYADILGSSNGEYEQAQKRANQVVGIQKQVLHQGRDLVVLSTGRMNLYKGYAYRPSLMPPGVTPQALMSSIASMGTSQYLNTAQQLGLTASVQNPTPLTPLTPLGANEQPRNPE
jgi:Protein of unknown function (DUF2844)